MKILVLDNPECHKDVFTGETGKVYKHINEVLSYLNNGGAELARDFSHADTRLQKKGIDLVIIHHTDFKEVNLLRKKYPEVPFWGYSNGLLDRNNCPPGSISKKFRDDFEKAYDFVTENTFLDLQSFIEAKKESFRTSLSISF